MYVVSNVNVVHNIIYFIKFLEANYLKILNSSNSMEFYILEGSLWTVTMWRRLNHQLYTTLSSHYIEYDLFFVKATNFCNIFLKKNKTNLFFREKKTIVDFLISIFLSFVTLVTQLGYISNFTDLESPKISVQKPINSTEKWIFWQDMVYS